MAVLLFFIPLAVGVALLLRGWRGKRVDDHPLCRRCGYDLVAGVDAQVCPECGRDVTSPGAIRIGHRRRRMPSLVIGGLLLMATLGAGGVFTYALATRFDFNPYKPLWLLTYEAKDAAQGAQAVAAQQEIMARLAAGRLSPSQIEGVVQVSLAIQADPRAAWHTWRGDFIEQAWQAGAVSNDTIKTYARTAVEGALSVDIPRVVRQGQMMWVYQSRRPMRAGRQGIFMVDIQHGSVVLEDGTALSGGGGSSRSSLSAGSSGRSGSGKTMDLPLGKHVAAMEALIRVDPPAAAGLLPGAGGEGPIVNTAEPIAEWTMCTTTEFEVVAADAEVVERVRDPSLEEAMRKSIVIERCRASDLGPPGAMIDCEARLDDPPIAGAFDIFIRVGGRDWPVGVVVGRQNNDGLDTPTLPMMPRNGPKMNMVPLPEDAVTVDLVFRPSVPTAEQAGLTRIWDGELVLKDVPIERPFLRRRK